METPQILIAGIGGIGGILAGKLLASGYEPVLLTNNQSISDAINSNGVIIRENRSSKSFKTTAYTSSSDLKDDISFGYIFLVMKTTQIVEAAKLLYPFLRPQGYVVTFQNGVVFDHISEIVPPDKIITAIIGWEGKMYGPGVYEKNTSNSIHLGKEIQDGETVLAQVSEILNNVSPIIVTDNLQGVLWSKLAINSTLTTFGALTGETLGTMLSVKEIRTLFLVTYREVFDIAFKQEITPERIAANPMVLYMPKNAHALHRFFKYMVLRILGRRFSNVRGSMIQSIERGREPEINFINGHVVKVAKEMGLNAPVNELITEMIWNIHRGELSPSMENINILTDRLSSLPNQ